MSHSLNSEQTSKLRSMVKSKLMEIGEYVDDQLTDYVMIMVTNKKSEKQMAEDLELFLGGKEKSTAFSSWLHITISNLVTGVSDHYHRKSSSSSSKNINHNKLTSKSSTNIETDELAIQIENDEEFNDDFNDEKSTKTITKKREESIQMETLSNKTPEREKSPLPLQSTSQKIISSCIGAVINRENTSSRQYERRNRDGTREEESPEKSSKRLSSIIKVSERKYTVPKEMQPNKNILLKAVNEANNSVTSRPKRSTHNESPENSPSSRIIKTKNSDNKLELFSQHFHHRKNEENVKRMRTNLNYKTSHYEMDGDELMNEDRSRIFDFADKRRVQIESDSVALRQLDTNKRELIIVNSNPTDEIDVNLNSTNTEPKFIVTLNGVNEEKFLSKKRSYSDMQNENEDHEMDEHQKESQAVEEEYMEDDSLAASRKKLIRCTFWPMCDKGDTCPYLHPNKPCTAFPNCQFGQQCHYLHPSCRYDGYCTRLDCPYTHVIKKPTVNPSPVAIKKQDNALTIPVTADAVSDTATAPSTVSSSGGPKITINKIQPLYSLVNNPTSSNSADNVKTASARPNPFYKQTPIIFTPNQYSLINRATTSNTVLINCKYGNICKNPKCIYMHPNLPQKSQLKWTANSNSSTNGTSSTNLSVTANQVLIQSDPNEEQIQQASIDNHGNSNNHTMIMSN